MPKITVTIDDTLCITAANCVGAAPKLFTIGPSGFGELLNKDGVPQGGQYTLDVSPEDAELLEEAAEACPTRAISFRAD